MNPLHLIDAARLLLAHAGRPRQANLKRAISTAYYAMFHALCRNCADSLVGKTSANRSESAWRQMYRSVEHGFAKSQCANNRVMRLFPADIEAFAANFSELQGKRHEADYNPASSYQLDDVRTWIKTAETDINRLSNAPIKDLRAFAVWVTAKHRS